MQTSGNSKKKSKRHARDKKKNTDKDMKNAFNVLISRWEKSGKSLSLRIWQQKLLKLKSKE